uniref:RNA-directed DNA polymerase from mobile element jockey-like n=1 Tax=Saccoglossus kowalevskii TaxID=10224 RepID=A0ABM0MXI2_SACKO
RRDKFDIRKSVGYDGIHLKLVKVAAEYIAEPIAYIINCSLSKGVFPDKLKKARVTPIFKKRCAYEVGNYRPISVLPVFSKLFESFANKQLCAFMDKFKILSENQYGFRRQYSTKLALADLTAEISKRIDEDFVTLGAFIDLRKAFDTIDHSNLLAKLQQYGIRWSTLNWFKTFLDGRQQYVSTKNNDSDCETISTGVPQGSI